jgi:diguanylate cyclase (GGDEF)-like protein/PAS domain S-box-containing protein
MPSPAMAWGVPRPAIAAGPAAEAAPDAGATWAAIAAMAGEGLFAVDGDGRIVQANPALATLLGQPASETGSHGWWPLLHPHDAERVRRSWAHGTAGGEPFELTFRIRRTDAAVVPLRVRLRPHDGLWIGVAEDTGVRHRAESDVHRLLAAVRDHLVVLVTDAGDRIVEVNEACCALLGQPRDALLGRTLATIARGTAAPTADAAGAPVSWHGEQGLRTGDGRTVWLDLVRVAMSDGEGGIDRRIAFGVDVTARREQTLALARSEELLNRTGEVAGVGGWQLDVEDGRLSWSQQTCRIHGVPVGYRPRLDEALRFFEPSAQLPVRAAIDAALRFGRDWDLELGLLRADAQRIVVRFVGNAEVEAGRVVRLYGALQDVSDQVAQREALQAAHARIALATDSGGIGVWDRDVRSGRLVWDRRMHELFGTSERVGEDAEGTWRAALHPEDRDRVLAASAAAQRGFSPLDIAYRIVRPDGSVRHLHGAGRLLLDGQGRPARMVGVNWDVTPLRRLSAELADQHELLRITLRSIADGVVTTDADGAVTWLNPVAEALTGWPAAEASGRPLALVVNLLQEETRTPVDDPVRAVLSPGRRAGGGGLLVARDGREIGVEHTTSPILDEQGAVRGAVLVFRDVTEQRRLAGEMRWRAAHDVLTGLVNRGEFEARLSGLLQRARDDGSEHALMLIDLDRFKLVNDACGHAAGDQLLQQVARLLGDAVRARDTLARLGGDEFAVLLAHCPLPRAQRIAQGICQRMDDFRFVHEDRRFGVGTSIGVVPLDRRWATAAAAMQAADAACYAAKDAGRNRVHAWVETDASLARRQGEMRWATRLEQALDEGRFVLHAQRILPLAGDAADVEATDPSYRLHAELLLRMVDVDGRLVPPSAFMPAAERFNLASRVDRWVVARVVDALRALAAGPGGLDGVELLTVNLSGQSIGDRTFHRWALDRLDMAGPAACRCIGLEITETAAVTNLADAALFVEQVRARGVRVALDDFGAGASSFGYLRSLPVDLLKIDGRFIQGLVDDPLDAAAVRGFVDVARVMGVPTVAEFVDRPQLLEPARRLGIRYAQGHGLHRPEPVERLLAWNVPQAA